MLRLLIYKRKFTLSFTWVTRLHIERYTAVSNTPGGACTLTTRLENGKIRFFGIDGTNTTRKHKKDRCTRVGKECPHIIGKAPEYDDDGNITKVVKYRVMIEVDLGGTEKVLNTLHKSRVFVHPTIIGSRLDPEQIAEFEEAHKRLPMKNDFISLSSEGQPLAPLDNRVGQGQYVMQSDEAEHVSPNGTKDCVLEYTGITNVSFTAGVVDEYEYSYDGEEDEAW
jgi:hypothetical protein